ncbi:hypothetical protein M2272_000863 [Mycobacterium frederiksbergense]|uniref:Uncharacterized protein n=1 Tax=Mycolicibacterium frederiksbergense TaxID=117567 RepID=A0ABT6KU44_9MYCO|nr:hypothetical protein [Mycolicibacterium frederiksbergense]MDH6194242.1 hypothetical protein [Mycolicibacterium frederiksbergense]
MKLAKFVAAALTVGAFGFDVTGLGTPMASAQPVAPAPLKPGHGHDDCFPFCDNGPGRDFDRGRWDNKGPWWADNRHDWWDDRNGPPPWGWGPPPPVQWRGGRLPQSINYWGYNLNPVWDNGFRQWGVWLFGVWIPILGVGVA